MKVEYKINRIADWICYDSQDRYQEIELLLYALYQPDKSGLTRNIDDDYDSVLNYMKDK